MQSALKDCAECRGRLIEIDYYSQRIVGCIEWGLPLSDERFLMELPDDDLEALRDRVRQVKRAG